MLVGGRGLGYFKELGFKGGVHLVKYLKEVQSVAEQMWRKTLVLIGREKMVFHVTVFVLSRELTLKRVLFESHSRQKGRSSCIHI